MTGLGWLLWGLCAAAAFGAVAFVYRRWEAPGPGRNILIGLRFLALALVLLLLFDPRLPPRRGGGAHRRVVLLDNSFSMSLAADPGAPGGATRWQRAVTQARALAGRAGEVLVFGATPRSLPTDSLPRLAPAAPDSRLLPALQTVSETGAGRVIVLSDGGLQDVGDVARWIPRLGLDVELRPVATASVPDFGVADVTAPAWAQAGKPFEIAAEVATAGTPADSVDVVVRQHGAVLAQRRVPRPPPGRTQPAPLTFTPVAPGPGGGLVRYDIAVTARDAVPDDDERSIYVFVGEEPPGVALVSFHPDWEPRFLLPVLEDALGMPTRGFLMVAPGRYFTTGAAQESGRPATEAQVRQAVDRAELVVLHNISVDAPAWAVAAARSLSREILFPAGTVPDLGLPFPLPAPSGGEWYVSSNVPSSPVAPLLTGIDPTDVPPLTAMRPLGAAQGVWAPLDATLGRNGTPAPLAVAGQTGGRRWAVALAAGYWQWAFRGGNGRDIYTRLWSALGGWLIQERRALAGAAIRPTRRVVPRGEAIAWSTAGLGADSVALRVVPEAGGAPRDTGLTVSADTAVTRPLPPGHYRYAARAFARGKQLAAADGPFTVERFSPDFLRPLLPASALTAAGSPLAPGTFQRGRGAPLHTAWWPWALVVAALAAEWILRRRWGLR